MGVCFAGAKVKLDYWETVTVAVSVLLCFMAAVAVFVISLL